MQNLTLPRLRLLAAFLESLEADKAIDVAAETGLMLLKELNSNEQVILGNVFIVLGSILTKSSCFSGDSPKEQEKNKWQRTREKELELLEIQTEIQKAQKRLNEFINKHDNLNPTQPNE